MAVARSSIHSGILGGGPTVSTVGLLGQSLAIGPIVSAGFGMFLLAGSAGASTPFVILVVGVGSAALGWCVSRYARRYAGAGTVYEYVARRISGGAGVLAAGMFFLPAVVANGTALVTSLLWRDFAIEHLGFDPGWWTGGIVSVVLAVVLAHRGMRTSTSFVLSLTALSALPFVVTAVAVIVDGGAGGQLPGAFTPEYAASGDLLHSVVFGILLFIGFEAAASGGEEAAEPHRAIPRAILLSIGVVGCFYLLVAYAGTIGFGRDSVASIWGQDPTAFSELGDRYVGPPTSMLMALGVLLDGFAVQLAIFNQFGRGYFVLARDGLLPRPIARVSSRGTPIGGVLVVAASTLLVLGFAGALDNRFDAFEVTATALTLTSLPVFVVLAVGSVSLVHGRLRQRVQAGVAAVAVVVPLLGLYGTFDPRPTGLRAAGVALAAVMTGGLLCWWAILARRRPDLLRGAARLALVREPASGTGAPVVDHG